MSSVSNETLTIILLILIAVIAVLVITVVSLFSKVKRLTTPKFGFLGKPLYVGVFAVMAIATVYVATSITKQKIDDINAQKEVKIEITTLEKTRQNGYVTVEFLATPSINGNEWGNKTTDTFDLYWSINGPEVYSQIKQGLSFTNKGVFNLEIKEGTYNITIVTIYNSKTYETTKTVSF